MRQTGRPPSRARNRVGAWVLRVTAQLRLVICAALCLLWAVKVPEHAKRETDMGVAAVAIAGWYLAVILVGRRSSLGATALTVGGAVLSTPYMAIIWLFSGWSESSGMASRWLLYAMAGNAMLFLVGIVELVAMLRSKRAP